MTIALNNELERLSNKPAATLNKLYWFPLGLFGVLSLMAAATFYLWDPASSNSWLFYITLGPLAAVATGLWFKKQGDQLGIHTSRPGIYPTIWVPISIACGAIGALVEDQWIFPMILLLVGLGNTLLGVIDRSTPMATVGIGLGCLGIMGGLGDINAWTFNLLIGLFLVGSSATLRVLR